MGKIDRIGEEIVNNFKDKLVKERFRTSLNQS